MKVSILLCLLMFTAANCVAQVNDSSRIYFTTAVGTFLPQSSFANAYQNSLALNSGIEYRFGKTVFVQFVLDFNAVKYNQQIKDAASNYLFQNTNSSVFLAGGNIGKNIALIASKKLFVSPYIGIGYANIGEPRLSVNTTTGIVLQDVTRMQGIYLKEGLRLGFNTTSKILQTIYFDASFWSANINVQNSKPKAFTILLGTRVGF
ncbi:MAG: hypothetical protein QM541_09520 [Flavobacterium sp.]|nr:hypothetical protein [Flavobacterium sp.]